MPCLVLPDALPHALASRSRILKYKNIGRWLRYYIYIYMGLLDRRVHADRAVPAVLLALVCPFTLLANHLDSPQTEGMNEITGPPGG